jgi:protein-disulfide isomerase
MNAKALTERRSFRLCVLAAIGLVFACTVSVRADEHGTVFGERETRAIESIITDYLIDNPEVVVRALQVLQEREDLAEAEKARLAIKAHRDALERDPDSPVAGNPAGDVTVVEFFDYRCPYCKKAAPDVVELLKSDGNIRLVNREWPILGPESVFAARAALAAREQGKYLEFHDRVMGQQQDGTMRLAEALGINGTPAFIVGDQLIPGVAPLEVLQALVERVRSQAAAE